MTTAESWRNLRDDFRNILYADHQQCQIAGVHYGHDDWNTLGIVRGWFITLGDEEPRRQCRRLARAAALLLGYSQREDGNEWADWLASLANEPLLQDRLRSRHRDDEGIQLIEIRDLCWVSSEYCEFLASGAARPSIVAEANDTVKVAAPPPFPKRAKWLQERLSNHGLSANALECRHGGPNHETIKRILNGLRVHNDSTLTKLAGALTDAGIPTKTEDIPQN